MERHEARQICKDDQFVSLAIKTMRLSTTWQRKTARICTSESAQSGTQDNSTYRSSNSHRHSNIEMQLLVPRRPLFLGLASCNCLRNRSSALDGLICLDYFRMRNLSYFARCKFCCRIHLSRYACRITTVVV